MSMSRRQTLAHALSHAMMRRALITYALVSVVEYAAYFTVILIAFDAGGGSLAGVAAAVQLAPSVLVPLIIRWVDRRHLAPMRFALVWVFSGLVAGALAAGSAPVWAVIAAAALRSLGHSLARPIHMAVVPVHAERTSDATAAMVVTGWIDAGGAMIGPALAGAILALLNPSAVFVAMSVLCLVGLWLSPVTGEVVGSGADRVERSVFSIRGAKSMLVYKTIAAALSGSTDVIVVLVAIELLGLGDDGAGYLASLIGIGELAGSLLLLSLLGRARLRGALGSAAFGRGALVSLVGVLPQAFPLFVLAGGFRPAHRVVQRLLLQRITPPDRYMRMFGVSEAFDSGGQALGAAIVPLLVLVFDVRWAIVIAGAFLPLTFLAMRRAFADIDDRAVIPQPIIDALSGSPIFDGLSADAVEYLARTSTAMSIGPGERLMAQGDVHADAAWLILAGAVDVVIDGEAVARLRRPDLVGEIALIHSAPRNASVVAHTACELLRIDHETFLDVVVGGRSGGDHVRVLAARRIEENDRR
jgi:MFS family permease